MLHEVFSPVLFSKSCERKHHKMGMNFSEVVVARSAGEGEGKEAAVLIGCGGRIDSVRGGDAVRDDDG